MNAVAGVTATRVVWIVACTVVLWLVLYSPAKTTSSRYAEILSQEHQAYSRVIGPDVADRMLSRLDRLRLIPRAEDMLAPVEPADGSTPTNRVANRMAAVVHRFFAHQYFRSMDGLVALAAFRASALYELGVILLGFLTVALVDAVAVRRARAAEHRSVSAERFRLSELASILLLALLFVAWFLPIALPPSAPTLVLLALMFFVSRMVSSYHRVL